MVVGQEQLFGVVMRLLLHDPADLLLPARWAGAAAWLCAGDNRYPRALWCTAEVSSLCQGSSGGILRDLVCLSESRRTRAWCTSNRALAGSDSLSRCSFSRVLPHVAGLTLAFSHRHLLRILSLALTSSPSPFENWDLVPCGYFR